MVAKAEGKGESLRREQAKGESHRAAWYREATPHGSFVVGAARMDFRPLRSPAALRMFGEKYFPAARFDSELNIEGDSWEQSGRSPKYQRWITCD